MDAAVGGRTNAVAIPPITWWCVREILDGRAEGKGNARNERREIDEGNVQEIRGMLRVYPQRGLGIMRLS